MDCLALPAVPRYENLPPKGLTGCLESGLKPKELKTQVYETLCKLAKCETALCKTSTGGHIALMLPSSSDKLVLIRLVVLFLCFYSQALPKTNVKAQTSLSAKRYRGTTALRAFRREQAL